MTDAKAVGKQMFLEFDNGLWLRVHLGIYGAWDFAGDFTVDATTASANGRMGQTNQRGTVLEGALCSRLGPDTVVGSYEDSLSSIGAPASHPPADVGAGECSPTTTARSRRSRSARCACAC